MSDSSVLVEYLELQGSAKMVTKSELIQAVRDRGLSISDRNLSFYTSSNLIPPAIRVGSRGGAYPAVVVEQLGWVIQARAAQLSIDAIRELLPLWRVLVRGRTERRIDLAEVEFVARQHNLSLEANYKVPFLFYEVLRCLCNDCLGDIEWILKDGTTCHHAQDAPISLSFILGKVNEETGQGEMVAWTQMTLPNMSAPDVDSPTTITLGVPVGMRVVLPTPTTHVPRMSRTNGRQEEVLPLA